MMSNFGEAEANTSINTPSEASWFRYQQASSEAGRNNIDVSSNEARNRYNIGSDQCRPAMADPETSGFTMAARIPSVITQMSIDSLFGIF